MRKNHQPKMITPQIQQYANDIEIQCPVHALTLLDGFKYYSFLQGNEARLAMVLHAAILTVFGDRYGPHYLHIAHGIKTFGGSCQDFLTFLRETGNITSITERNVLIHSKFRGRPIPTITLLTLPETLNEITRILNGLSNSSPTLITIDDVELSTHPDGACKGGWSVAGYIEWLRTSSTKKYAEWHRRVYLQEDLKQGWSSKAKPLCKVDDLPFQLPLPAKQQH